MEVESDCGVATSHGSKIEDKGCVVEVGGIVPLATGTVGD